MMVHEKLAVPYKNALQLVNEILVSKGESAINPNNITNVRLSDAKRKWGSIKHKGKKSAITISERLLEFGDKAVEETIIHELLHAHPTARYRGHGSDWRYLAGLINRNTEYNITRVVTHEEIEDAYNVTVEKPKAKHRISCVNCNETWEYLRNTEAVKHPARYSCHCGGKLKKDY